MTSADSNSFPGPFSPDGSLLVCTGFGLTNSFIKTVNLNGSGQAQVAYVPDSNEGFPDWSPDGKQIVFTSRRDGNNEIYVMSADGSNPIRLTNNPTDDFAPNWSPDGSQIAFVSDRDRTIGYYSIYIMKTDGSSISIKLSELVIFLVFSHSIKIRAIFVQFPCKLCFLCSNTAISTGSTKLIPPDILYRTLFLFFESAGYASPCGDRYSSRAGGALKSQQKVKQKKYFGFIHYCI